FAQNGGRHFVASYTVPLKALCISSEVEEARFLLDEMPERGIEPDIIGDDTVLDGYDRIRRGSRAGREIRKKACVGT
ncbi:hypothetical protein BHE74_00048729, partial [Ensete ventricosum]